MIILISLEVFRFILLIYPDAMFANNKPTRIKRNYVIQFNQ